MRHCKLALDLEGGLLEPPPHGLRVEIEVQACELHRLTAPRAPILAAEQPAQDGFEVLLVGVLQHEDRPRLERAPHFLERAHRFRQMVEHADHGGRFKRALREGQAVDVSRHVQVARIPQPRPRLLEL